MSFQIGDYVRCKARTFDGDDLSLHRAKVTKIEGSSMYGRKAYLLQHGGK